MSWPTSTTESSFSISSSSAPLSDSARQLGCAGHGAKASSSARRVLSTSASTDAQPFRVDDARRKQVFAVSLDGIVCYRRGEFFGFAVAGVGIGRGVSSDARGPQLDEARRSRRFDVAPRLEATEVRAVGIVSRDGPGPNAESVGAIGNRGQHLFVTRLGDRPPVVLADEQHRSRLDRSQVQRLRHVAFAGRTVAEVDDHGFGPGSAAACRWHIRRRAEPVPPAPGCRERTGVDADSSRRYVRPAHCATNETASMPRTTATACSR